MRMADFECAACGAGFEALVGSPAERPPCPQCGNVEVTRRPVLGVAVHARKGPRGRVIDLSSHACPASARSRRA